MLVKHVFSTMASQSSLFAYFSDRKESQEEPVDSSDESERDIEESGSGKEIGEIDIVEPPSKKKKSKRSFCKSWLDKFVWLRYDDVEEAMFCYYLRNRLQVTSVDMLLRIAIEGPRSDHLLTDLIFPTLWKCIKVPDNTGVFQHLHQRTRN